MRYVALAISCVVSGVGCFPIDISTKSKGAPKTGIVRGVVTNANGDLLEDVSVATSNGDDATLTDDKGRYQLTAATGSHQLRFGLQDHVSGFYPVNVTADFSTLLDVALLPRAAAMQLDAAEGGTLTAERGASITLPANALVDGSGKKVTGMVDVFVTPLDPSSTTERTTEPQLVTKVEGDTLLIDSVGLLDIEIEQDGDTINVANGKTIEISIPTPDAADQEPAASVSFWSFDEPSGFWDMAGGADYDDAAHAYVGEVKQRGLWNAGAVYDATCICGIVQASDKANVPGARVEARGVSYFGLSTAQTDKNGNFCIAVKQSSDVDVAVYHATGGGETKRLHTRAQDTLVPPKSSDARCEDVGTWRVKTD